MPTTTLAARPTVRGSSNETLDSAELRVRFRALVDLSPEDYETEALAGHQSHSFTPGDIVDDPNTDREKWLYVFLADLREGSTTAIATSLQYEGQYDAQGELRLVDWSGGAGSHPGLDRRPVSQTPVPDGILTLTAPGRRAHHGRPQEGIRTVHLAFLSHVPLPAHRLDRYFSNDPEVRLPARALLVDPDALASEGGFGMTLASGMGSPSETRWVRWSSDRSHARAYLIEPIDFAFRLHEWYTAKAGLFDAFTMDNAEKMLHASLTRAVATGYKTQEEFDRKGKTDADVPGQVFDALGRYEDEVATEHAKLEFWAHHLYGYWLETASFQLAREDASDLGPASGFSEDRHRRLDAEVARQGELLRGAERSLEGRHYLAAHFAEANAGDWYDRVALGSRVTARLADVPKIYFERLQHRAAETAKEIATEQDALYKRQLGAAADYLSAMEFARAQAPNASGVIDARQIKLLDPMAQAVAAATSTPTPGASLREAFGLPGQLDQALRTGQGLGAIPVWQALATGGSPVTGSNADGASLIVTEASDSKLVYGPEPIVTYGGPTLDRGLVVLTGSDGSEAMADLRGTLKGAAPADPAGPASAKRSALSRLLDVTGRPMSENAGVKLQRLREAVAAKRTELNDAQLREQVRTTQVNWAGRLFFALNVVDLVAGVAETQAKIEAGDRSLGRGASHWDAYLGAVGAGAGAASAFAGIIESAEALIPAALVGGRLATVLGIASGVGAVLAVVAGTASLITEIGTHDTMGAVSAGFAVAAGLVGVAAAFATIPVAGWVVAAVILVLAGLSLLFHFLSDTPIEEWLKNCIWSALEAGEVAGLAPNALRVGHEVEDLLVLLASPRVSVELREVPARSASRLKRYQYGVPVAAPDRVRLVVRPGLHPPGSRIEITRFRVLLPASWGEWLEEVLPFSEGERDEVSMAVGGTFPSLRHDVVLVHDEAGPAFVREWPGTVLPLAIRTPSGHVPNDMDFTCRATVRLPHGSGSVADPSFDLEGAIGFAIESRGTVYQTRPSTSSSEPIR